MLVGISVGIANVARGNSIGVTFFVNWINTFVDVGVCSPNAPFIPLSVRVGAIMTNVVVDGTTPFSESILVSIETIPPEAFGSV